MKTRLALLFLAGGLVAAAVVMRVWLAATGGYSDGPVSVPVRVVSAVALAVGFLFAGAIVIWPVRISSQRTGMAADPQGDSEADGRGGHEDKR